MHKPAERFYLQSAEDARVLHALVCGQLAKASAKDVEMPQDLSGRITHRGKGRKASGPFGMRFHLVSFTDERHGSTSMLIF